MSRTTWTAWRPCARCRTMRLTWLWLTRRMESRLTVRVLGAELVCLRIQTRKKKSLNPECMVALANCDHVAVENPVCIMSSAWRKPDQIIQPYQFGHPYTKTTCLWLKGLPPLTPTNILQKPENGWENQQITKDGRYGGYGGKWGCKQNGKWLRYGDPRVAKERSKTFPGIARAMAEQWTSYIEKEKENHP